MRQDERYTRQTILAEIGQVGQKRLSQARVLCIGAGGLGCPALLYLAGAGVGHIGIVDFDTVHESNLHRQVLYTTAQTGQNKAQAARANLQALNPHIDVQAYPVRFTATQAEALISSYDLIIDGTDNFASTFLINDAAVKYGKPVVYGAVLGFEGQVAVFDATRGACYRCLFPAPPAHDVPDCNQAGVIGAAAGMIGTMQAMEAIKVIIAQGRDGEEARAPAPLYNTLLCLDTRTMAVKRYTAHKKADCPVCSVSASSITLPEDLQDRHDSVPEVEPAVIRERLKTDPDMILVDVREPAEWEDGTIDGASLFALSRLLDGAPLTWPKDTPLVLYCKAGARSLRAAQFLQAKGYTNLQNMTGGYTKWSAPGE